MKLTDLAIVFQIFFICLTVVLHMNEVSIYNQMFNQTMFNNVFDIIAEDSLRAGFKSIDNKGNPIVDLDSLVDCFRAEADFYGDITEHILCYIDRDGIYICSSNDSFMWSDKIYFIYKEDTPHEGKVCAVISKLEEIYGTNILLPYNNGEEWGNTVNDYSLIVISYNKALKVNCISGALIEELKKN